MPAEDFEEDYISEDKNFAVAIYGLGWALISILVMFIIMGVIFNILAGLTASVLLVLVYAGHMIIDWRCS